MSASTKIINYQTEQQKLFVNKEIELQLKVELMTNHQIQYCLFVDVQKKAAEPVCRQVIVTAFLVAGFAGTFCELMSFKTTQHNTFIQQIQKELLTKVLMQNLLDTGFELQKECRSQGPPFDVWDDGDSHCHIDENKLQKEECLASTLLQDQRIQDQVSSNLLWLQFRDDRSEYEAPMEQTTVQFQEIQQEIELQQSQQLTPNQKLNVGKAKEPQSTNRSQCKNFLPLIKKCFERLFSLNPNACAIAQTFGFINKKRATSLKEMEEYFKIKEMKLLFAEAFYSRSLKRELQNSRISQKNRVLFMREITLLKKAFIKQKLSNL